MQMIQKRRISPGRLLFTSLCGIVALGTVLLSLPFAQAVPVRLFDTLFTTVSTVCVTGMQVVPMSSFSYFGQIIILILMQVGGLGLMTFSFFIASLFLNLGMTSKLMAGQLFEFESWNKIKSFLTVMILVTLGLEALGAILLFRAFSPMMNTHAAMFHAIFHSVSAFCNTGISLFENNMVTFSNNIAVLSTLSFLVVAGGIGFLVWYEVAHSIRNFFLWVRNKACPLFSFSLHTRLALMMSTLLIVLGTLCIWGIEHHNSLAHTTGGYSWLNALFLSISVRSAGFMVCDLTTMSNATILILLALMMIGASPGSTGSGIKTTTFALFCASVGAIIQNRDAVEISGRTIPNDQMQKVVGVFTVALSWVVLTTLALLLLEPQLPFLSVLVEAVSAFSTCGISMGVTPQLCLLSKIVLMATMMIGRIGLLTLVLSLRKSTQKHLYRYPEERVLLG